MLITVFLSIYSFLHTKETRYSVNMSSVIPEEKWRKGSQVSSLSSF